MKIILETKRLILREYEDSDFDNLYQILSNKENMKYYPKPYDKNGTKKWIDWNKDNYQRYGFGLWAIILKSTNEFIGDCGITMQNIDNEILPEIGYHINKNFFRQGFGKEAATAVKEWFFNNTSYDNVYSYMAQDNIGSYKLALSIGMKEIKKYTNKFGENLLVYSISRNK